MPLLLAYSFLFQTGVWAMVVRTGVVGKAVLLVLLAFSIASWTIIVHKAWLFQKVDRADRRAIYALGRAETLGEAARTVDENPSSPAAHLLRTAGDHVRLRRMGNPHGPEGGIGLAEAQVAEVLAPIRHALNRERVRRVHQLERHLPFLATAGSVSPFIGLLGTVWGIMKAFLDIGLQGSARLSVVGPGIAEALIATAAGLAVAIPALIAYNHFAHRLAILNEELESFTDEVLLRVAQEGGV